MSKLPQEPSPKAIPEVVSPQTRQAIRRIFLTLLTVGIVIGGLTALGVVKLMHHLHLFGVPEQPAHR